MKNQVFDDNKELIISTFNFINQHLSEVSYSYQKLIDPDFKLNEKLLNYEKIQASLCVKNSKVLARLFAVGFDSKNMNCFGYATLIYTLLFKRMSGYDRDYLRIYANKSHMYVTINDIDDENHIVLDLWSKFLLNNKFGFVEELLLDNNTINDVDFLIHKNNLIQEMHRLNYFKFKFTRAYNLENACKDVEFINENVTEIIDKNFWFGVKMNILN